MARGQGFTRSPLERARQTRTMTARGLDILDHNYAEARKQRVEKLAQLDREIQSLEKAENE